MSEVKSQTVRRRKTLSVSIKVSLKKSLNEREVFAVRGKLSCIAVFAAHSWMKFVFLPINVCHMFPTIPSNENLRWISFFNNPTHLGRFSCLHNWPVDANKLLQTLRLPLLSFIEIFSCFLLWENIFLLHRFHLESRRAEHKQLAPLCT